MRDHRVRNTSQKAWNRGAGRSTPMLFDVLAGTAEPDE